jgi:hypothetical protein
MDGVASSEKEKKILLKTGKILSEMTFLEMSKSKGNR